MGQVTERDRGRAVDAPPPADTGNEQPLTPRGQRTKEALLVAARTVFERDGFLDARVTDIAEEAGVAHGTFYTYFESKDEIFRAVVQSIQGDFHQRSPGPEGETPYEAILRSNRQFYEIYAERAAILRIAEQVATFDDAMMATRNAVRRWFIDRAERTIRRWQEEGLADLDLDARYAASALGSMVDRSVYTWLVMGEPHDPEIALATISRLWTNALGLTTPRLGE